MKISNITLAKNFAWAKSQSEERNEPLLVQSDVGTTMVVMTREAYEDILKRIRVFGEAYDSLKRGEAYESDDLAELMKKVKNH